MSSVLNHELVFLTGKGGVGKTTLAAALGMVAADRGQRTIVVELGDQSRLPALFGVKTREAGVETMLRERLWSITVDPDQALLEWLQQLGGRVSGRLLASSGTFQYFAAAAPGAKELVSMVKIWELTQGERWHRHAGGYDLVLIDAPATGHALGLLQSPQTFGAIARVGPIAGQSQRVRELLQDPVRSGYVAVALATEMAVTEALELQDGLQQGLGRSLDTVLLNGLLPSRFNAAELERMESVNGTDVGRSAARAARAVHDRARFQHNQLARLRRRRFEVLGIPFLFGTELDLAAVEKIASQLARRL
jgi:anion-transporting  ArsA/GET3 family ATPase